MSHLQAFRERILYLLRTIEPFASGSHVTFADLAGEIGLSRTELSRRLSGKGKVPLSHANAEAIVRALTKWGALQTQVAATQLLALANFPPFPAAAWRQPPLDQLAPAQHYAATVPTGQTNLPLPITSFTGRSEELAALGELLTRTHLLTITGAGGIGKTRLATELGLSLHERYANGTWFVNLTHLRDRNMVLCAIALVLAVRDEPGRDIALTLTDCLRPQQLLLILDNCEHIIDAVAAAVKLLLANCPQMRILTTSREPLSLAGEVEWRLSPLTVPTPEQPLPSRVSSYAAVDLFVQRAQAVQPRFRLTERNTLSVVQICRQLDGIPLALELAAPLVKVLSVEQITARIADRFKLLRNADPTAPPQQQTLRASLEWSYALLDEGERTLLRRLAAFGDGWDIEAAEAVCSGAYEHAAANDPPQTVYANPDVLGGHIQLLNKSLLQLNEDAAPLEGVARYAMLETVRQFASEYLASSGEEQTVRQFHAAYYLGVAEQAAAEWTKVRQATWRQRLELENANLRVALGWLLRRGEVTLALRLAVALWPFWLLQGHRQEGGYWLRQILALPAPANRLRAAALIGLGRLYAVDYNYVAAEQCYVEATAICRTEAEATDLAPALEALDASLREGQTMQGSPTSAEDQPREAYPLR